MRIPQNFFTWFHPSWSSVSETKIKIPGQGLRIPPQHWRSFRCVCETGCKPVQKRSRPLNFTVANVHGSCPANHFLTVKALGPPLLHHPGAKTLRRKNHHGAGTEGCSKWRPIMANWNQDISRQKSSNCWLSLMMRKANMPGKTSSHALMKADHVRKSQETCALRAVRRFSATLACAQAEQQPSEAGARTAPRLLGRLDNMKSTYIQRYACRWLKYFEFWTY